MRTRIIHLINPQTNQFTTRPMYFNRALYSPLAGLLAVAAVIPQDRYEVVMTDENIEDIDFDLKVDMVGISAMTSYVKRGYEIADRYRAKGVPVVIGGVHASFMPQEALQHCDAVVIGEAELVMPKVLDDLDRGELKGIYRADTLHPMVDVPIPRYDLVKKNRYVNRTFVQTSRGCHQGCTFCAEPLMNGLKFRYRPVDEVIHEIENCGQRTISLNDADFFGTEERPKEVMRALRGRGIRWQAAATSKLAQKDEMLELAAESGCYMLSIGFESISRDTLKRVHKYVNRPEQFAALVEKIHSYGIMVFGLFMFGFGGDDETVFDETTNVQHRRQVRRLRLFGADPLSRHAHLVRDEEGRADRLLRLGSLRPGAHRLPAGEAQHPDAPRRPHAGLPELLLAAFDRQALPAHRLAQPAPLEHLQRLLPPGRGDGTGDGEADRGCHARAHDHPGAADHAAEARMA